MKPPCKQRGSVPVVGLCSVFLFSWGEGTNPERHRPPLFSGPLDERTGVSDNRFDPTITFQPPSNLQPLCDARFVHRKMVVSLEPGSWHETRPSPPKSSMSALTLAVLRTQDICTGRQLQFPPSRKHHCNSYNTTDRLECHSKLGTHRFVL